MSDTDPTAPDYDAERTAPRPASPPPPPSGSGSTAYPPPPSTPPTPEAPTAPEAPSAADAPAFPSYPPPPAAGPGPSDNPYAAAPPPPYGSAPANPYGSAPAAGPYGGPASPYGAPAGQVGLPGGGPLPSMGTRLLARIIDWVIVGVVYMILSFIGLAGMIGTSGSDGEPSGLAVGGFLLAMLLFSLISVAYEVVLIALRGATLGKQAMGIKVVLQDNGAIPGWGPSFIRWGIPALANFICGLGIIIYLSPFWADSTGRQRGYHDQAANTVVVSAR